MCPILRAGIISAQWITRNLMAFLVAGLVSAFFAFGLQPPILEEHTTLLWFGLTIMLTIVLALVTPRWN